MADHAFPGVETRGIALTGLSITLALIVYLEKSGRIPNEDAVDLFQAALEVLETFPVANDQAVQGARQLTEFLSQIMARRGTHGPAADRT
jgi:hypothetical protein